MQANNCLEYSCKGKNNWIDEFLIKSFFLDDFFEFVDLSLNLSSKLVDF